MSQLRKSLTKRRYSPRRHWPIFLTAGVLETGILVAPFVVAPWWWLGLVVLAASWALVPGCWKHKDFLEPILDLVLGKKTKFDRLMVATMVPAVSLVTFVVASAIAAAVGIFVILAEFLILMAIIVGYMAWVFAPVVIPVLVVITVAKLYGWPNKR